MECISVGNSLLVERVFSQWIYDTKGKASFKGSFVEDGLIAMAPQAGFEPATRCLEGSRSIP